MSETSDATIDVDPEEVGGWLARHHEGMPESKEMTRLTTRFFAAGVYAQQAFPNDPQAQGAFHLGYTRALRDRKLDE